MGVLHDPLPDAQWLPTTVWPAHTKVNLTIYQYDSRSSLRNQQLVIVEGTIGDVASLDGKVFRVINSNAGNGVGHTFSMPSLGINVPIYGDNANANLCGAAPCTTASPHNVIRFSFLSPGPGTYPRQCLVPCALWFPGRKWRSDADSRLELSRFFRCRVLGVRPPVRGPALSLCGPADRSRHSLGVRRLLGLIRRW